LLAERIRAMFAERRSGVILSIQSICCAVRKRAISAESVGS
jgi:hypothetical protein